MKRVTANRDGGQVSEMAIVDTFTKLIFGEDSQYSNRELRIISALRAVDANLVFDSHREMGTYLRAMGVGEMIELVARVQQQLQLDLPVMRGRRDTRRGQSSVLDRRLH